MREWINMCMEHKNPEGAKAVAGNMRTLRIGKRNAVVKSASSYIFSKRSSLMGKLADGSSSALRPRKGYKTVFLENGLVKLETGLAKTRAGKKILVGTEKKEIITDIFSATRMAVHIQERLEEAQKERDAIVGEIEKINALLYKKGEKFRPLGLYFEANVLEDVGQYMGDVNSVLKQNAKDMLIAAVASLKNAAVEPDEFVRRKHISIACTKLTAFRNRFGEWRDREVAEIMAFNRGRECMLRKERDVRLESDLRRWVATYSSAGKWAIRGKAEKDLRYAEKIEKIISVNMRVAKKAELIKELKKEMAEKKYSSSGRGFSLAYLDNASELYKRGAETRELGKDTLARGALLLRLGKPEFVAEKLIDSEKYLDEVSAGIRKAAAILEQIGQLPRKGPKRAEALSAAANCFRRTLRKMEEINCS